MTSVNKNAHQFRLKRMNVPTGQALNVVLFIRNLAKALSTKVSFGDFSTKSFLKIVSHPKIQKFFLLEGKTPKELWSSLSLNIKTCESLSLVAYF